MNEDFSEVINKFSEILKEKDIDISKMTGGAKSDASPNQTAEENSHNFNTVDEETNDFNLDIETIMKIKDIISKINSCKDSPRNHLLYSLKPYLETHKKEKLDKYIQIANLLNVMENMDLGISFLKDNKKGYDFILIITLVLLII